MGTWGPAIKSNDTSSDVYADFFDMYNEGEEPEFIYKTLIEKYKTIINDSSESNNFWFVIALALWETKSLDNETYQLVKSIIESENDLDVWRELGADESDIKKRKHKLNQFIEKIIHEKRNAKARKKKIFNSPIFEKGICLTFKLENGNYGGAIVLEEDNSSGVGYNLVITTKLDQKNKPNIQDFEKSKVLINSFGNWDDKPHITWFAPTRFNNDYSKYFEEVGKIRVERNYSTDDNELESYFSGYWKGIIISANEQLEYERNNRAPKLISIKDYIKERKWWKIN
jgi:hypothetical protein